MNRILVFVAVSALAVTPVAARAAVIVGAREMGSAGALVATGADAAALQSNPAAISGVHGTQLQVGLGGLSWFGLAAGSRSDSLLYGPVQFNAFAAGHVGGPVVLGIGLAPVWGAERNSYGDMKNESSSYSLLPSLSVRVADFLAIAAGAQLNRSSINARYDGPLMMNLSADGTSYGIGATLGALATFLDGRLVAGLGYRTPVSAEGDVVKVKLPYAVEAGVSLKQAESLRFGAQLVQSGEEYADTDVVVAVTPISSSTGARVGLEWDLASWMSLRSGLLVDMHRHASVTFVQVETMTGGVAPPSPTKVPTDTVFGAALGLGFQLPMNLGLDVGALWEKASAVDASRLNLGMSLVWHPRSAPAH